MGIFRSIYGFFGRRKASRGQEGDSSSTTGAASGNDSSKRQRLLKGDRLMEPRPPPAEPGTRSQKKTTGRTVFDMALSEMPDLLDVTGGHINSDQTTYSWSDASSKGYLYTELEYIPEDDEDKENEPATSNITAAEVPRNIAIPLGDTTNISMSPGVTQAAESAPPATTARFRASTLKPTVTESFQHINDLVTLPQKYHPWTIDATRQALRFQSPAEFLTGGEPGCSFDKPAESQSEVEFCTKLFCEAIVRAGTAP